MSRTASARQLAAIAADDRQIDWQVLIDDSGGSQVDWTDWVQSWEVTESQDRAVMTATVQMWREQGDTSLAPLVGSPSNIAANRDIEIRVAVVEQGSSVTSSDWEPVFRGKIDDPEWGGDAPTISVPARGPGRLLLKEFVETETEYGNDAGTDPIEDVMQDIIDDHVTSGPTMVVEGDPDFGILTYTQQSESVFQAHQALVDLIGWVARYKWDETSQDWAYTLYEPDRSKTTPDWTFSTGAYKTITDARLPTDTVRNRVEVKWSETEASYVAEDSTSQAEFGVQYMKYDVTGSQDIDTLTKATALGNAIVSDVGEPRFEQASIGYFNPFIELGDLCRFNANDIHYDNAQDMAVVAYTHEGSTEGVDTTLWTRGKPSGGVDRWFRRSNIARQKVDLDVPAAPTTSAVIATPTIGFDTDGVAIVGAAGNDQTVGIPVQLRTGTAPGTISAIATTSTTSAVSATDTSIPVSSTTNMAGNWLVVTNGNNNGEVRYCSAVGGGSITISEGLDYDYASGATVTSYTDIDATNIGAGISGESGSFKCDDTAAGGRPDVAVGLGEELHLIARGVNSAGALGQTVRASRRRGDTETTVPRVQVAAFRSGTSVSVEFTISDPTLAITANPSYKRRDGDDQSYDGTAQTSWDTSTGTAGTNTTLVRKVTLSDPYTAIQPIITWTDENGDTQTIGQELDLSSVQETDKEVTFSPYGFIAEDSGAAWAFDDPTSTNPALKNAETDSSDELFYSLVVIPSGSVITAFKSGARLSGNPVSASAEVKLLRDTTTLATNSHFSLGLSGISASLSHTVTASDPYIVRAKLNGDGVAGDAKLVYIGLEYSTPSVKQAY